MIVTPETMLDKLQNRLEWAMDDDEKRIAQGALEDLSADATFYGNPRWTEATRPAYVDTLILKAAQRYMRNPDGYEQSRAGDETVGWGQSNDDDKGAATFSRKELEALKSLVRPAVFGSVNVEAYGTRLRTPKTGLVPVAGYSHEQPFPYFPTDDGPW